MGHPMKLTVERDALRSRVAELESIVDEAYRLSLVIDSAVRWHEPEHYSDVLALVRRIVRESRERVLIRAKR